MIKEKNNLVGKFRVITTDSITGEVKRVTPFYKNKVVLNADRGADLILDRLNGTNTYSLNITHLDIGTSATAVSSADTGLIAGVARTAKATGTIASNVLTLRFFFASGDLANGTYREVGTFVDGTATLASGQLFSRALFGSAYTKGTNENSTFEWVYTLTT
jgi:hypothetical protein